MIQLLPGLRIKVSNKHSTYGRVKVKSIQLFLGKYISMSATALQCYSCFSDFSTLKIIFICTTLEKVEWILL